MDKLKLEKMELLVSAINMSSKYDNGYKEVANGITYDGRLLYLLRKLAEAIEEKANIKKNDGINLNIALNMLAVLKLKHRKLEFHINEENEYVVEAKGEAFHLLLKENQRPKGNFIDLGLLTEHNMVDFTSNGEFFTGRSSIDGYRYKFTSTFNENGLLEGTTYNHEIVILPGFSNFYLKPAKYIEYYENKYNENTLVMDSERKISSRNNVEKYKKPSEKIVPKIPGFMTCEYGAQDLIFIREEEIAYVFPELYDLAAKNMKTGKRRKKEIDC